jgi:TonB family protein
MDGVTMATQPTDTGKQQRTRAAGGDELAIIAQRAQAFTNASGVAIALAEGDNTDEIICRARSGASAPDVGTALRVEGTFTGLCIQTGKELRCDDAETDTRVDMTAIRALGIRAMVVTPIREDNRVIGVLAVFAPTAHAFTITHVAVLKTMADQISAAVLRERRAREEGAPLEPPRQYAPVAMPKPVAAVPVAVQPPVVIKPSASSPAAAAARAAAPSPAKVEPIRPLADEVAVPVAFPKREERSEVRASFGTFDAVAGEEKKSGASRLIVVAAVVLVVAAVSVFAFLKSRKPVQATPTQQATSSVPQDQSNIAPATASAPVAGNGQAVTQGVSATVTGSTTKPSAGLPTADAARSFDKNAKPAEKPADKVVAQDRTERVAATTAGLGPSRIAATGNVAPPVPDVAPTALSVSNANASSGALNVLTAESKSPVTPALAQSEVVPMSVVKAVPPVYPAIAQARHITGSVVVEVTVGKDGRAYNPKLVSGLPIFRDAAFDAVKQWVFKPARLNGQPIEQNTQIRVDFNPPSR